MKLKDQLNFLSFLLSDSKTKPEPSPRLRLPKITQKEQKEGSNETSNRKTTPEKGEKGEATTLVNQTDNCADPKTM